MTWSVTWPLPPSQQTSIIGVWPEKTLPSKSFLQESRHSISFSDLKWTLFGISYPLTKMWMDWSLYPRWRQRIIQYLELNFIRRRMLTSGLRSIQEFLTQGTNMYISDKFIIQHGCKHVGSGNSSKLYFQRGHSSWSLLCRIFYQSGPTEQS